MEQGILIGVGDSDVYSALKEPEEERGIGMETQRTLTCILAVGRFCTAWIEQLVIYRWIPNYTMSKKILEVTLYNISVWSVSEYTTIAFALLDTFSSYQQPDELLILERTWRFGRG